MAVAVLLPILQEKVTYDHQDDHDADPKEHGNHYLKGTCMGYMNMLELLYELGCSRRSQEEASTKADKREEVGNSWPNSRVVTAHLVKEERRQPHGIRLWPGYSQPVSSKS